MRAYLPDLLVADGAVRSGAALTVENGRVVAVGAPAHGAKIVRLSGRAIFPGLVSAHSHSFQRAIRGRTERRTRLTPQPPSPPEAAERGADGSQGRSTFWTWRTAMYEAANRLSPDDLHAVARMCFREMVRAGVTAVGEFHYLHRDPDGRPYADPAELERRVLAAAGEVGLRIVLLRTAYARAGYGLAADPLQRRMVEESLEDVHRGLEATVRAAAAEPLASVGVAPHSVRACPAEWIRALAEEARRRGLPLHLHAAEQPAEVAACKDEHRATPVGLLERLGALGERTTLVHAVHVDETDVRLLGGSRTTVCVCPTTERNLGDGIAPIDQLVEAGVPLALGTDSNVQIDPLEDARELEYHLRLVRLERAVLDVPPGSLPARLLDAATAGGMAALGLRGGRLAPGEPADFVAVDLEDATIAGAGTDDLLPLLVFALGRTAIRDVFVAGEPVIVEGTPAAGSMPDAQVVADFRRAMRHLWG
jgi:formimidoylglutamate deiminase